MGRQQDERLFTQQGSREVASHGVAVGKQTLTEQILHHETGVDESPTVGPRRTGQLQASGGHARAEGQGSEVEIANAGVSGPSTDFPHRSTIEQLFGRPVPATAHTDGAAAAATAQLGAKAYAFGGAVAFNSPSPGLHVAAHEAAHVVQQHAGVQLAGGVGAPGDIHEQQADAVADRVVSGRSAADLLDGIRGGGAGATRGVQRAPDAGAAAPGPAPGPAAAPAPPAAGATGAAAPGPVAATKPDEDWVSNPPPPDPAGEQKLTSATVAKGQLLDAITQVAPGLPHAVRVMLVGHSWVEQRGENVLNNNFAGMEGGSSSYVLARTSAVIARSEYDKNPSNYSDWGKGHTYDGRDASTIDVQLKRGETVLAVMTRKRRPAYASLASAAAAFVRNIEARFHKLQASPDPAHQTLVADAFSGDEKAYAKVITLKAPKLGILPYNPSTEYAGRVIAQINAARTDLASRAPAAP